MLSERRPHEDFRIHQLNDQPSLEGKRWMSLHFIMFLHKGPPQYASVRWKRLRRQWRGLASYNTNLIFKIRTCSFQLRSCQFLERIAPWDSSIDDPNLMGAGYMAIEAYGPRFMDSISRREVVISLRAWDQNCILDDFITDQANKKLINIEEFPAPVPRYLASMDFQGNKARLSNSYWQQKLHISSNKIPKGPNAQFDHSRSEHQKPRGLPTL